MAARSWRWSSHSSSSAASASGAAASAPPPTAARRPSRAARPPADRREAILLVARSAAELGLPVRGFASSGLPGPKGNRETFVWCGGEGPELEDLEGAIAAADAASPAAEEAGADDE